MTKKTKSPAKSSTTKKKSSSVGSVTFNGGPESSVSVRSIANGFIVSESKYVGKGRNQKWVNNEVFSPTNPVQITKPVVPKFGGKK